MGDSVFHDSPLEFVQSTGETGGYHDAQSVLPVGDHYVASCSCDAWEVEVATREEGLRLCRVHTGSEPG